MVVTATYSDASTKAVTGYTTRGFDTTTTGTKTITVTYEEKTATFTINVIENTFDPNKETTATPTANPTEGEVVSGTVVILSTTTEDAEIWYTTNGNTPTKDGASSIKYENPITITDNIMINAIAVKDGMNNSAVLTATYTTTMPFLLSEKLSVLQTTAESNQTYTVTVESSETLAPHTLSYESRENITIILKSTDASEKTITTSLNGSIFTVGSGVTLQLEENITLRGKNNNTASLVTVEPNAQLIMKTGSKISDNTKRNTSTVHGGGVYVRSYGIFTMEGGEISNNTVYSAFDNNNYFSYSYGGGVYVDSYGAFTMTDGAIAGNTNTYTSPSCCTAYAELAVFTASI